MTYCNGLSSNIKSNSVGRYSCSVTNLTNQTPTDSPSDEPSDCITIITKTTPPLVTRVQSEWLTLVAPRFRYSQKTQAHLQLIRHMVTCIRQSASIFWKLLRKINQMKLWEVTVKNVYGMKLGNGRVTRKISAISHHNCLLTQRLEPGIPLGTCGLFIRTLRRDASKEVL